MRPVRVLLLPMLGALGVAVSGCGDSSGDALNPIALATHTPKPAQPAIGAGSSTATPVPGGTSAPPGQPVHQYQPPPTSQPQGPPPTDSRQAPPSDTAAPQETLAPTQPPKPVTCPPEPEPPGTPQGSNLQFSGDCAFTETAKIGCDAQSDDLFISLHRTLPGDLPLSLSVNIEHYHGPGDYPTDGNVIMEILDEQTIYEWTDDTAHMVVTADSDGKLTEVDVPGMVLHPDPGTPTSGDENVAGMIGC